MTISNSRADREKAAYKENAIDGGTDRRTSDLTAHNKLDDLTQAVGGLDTTVTIYNITIAAADTEQSQALPANTKRFIIRARGNGRVQIAYTSGDSGTLYMTLRPGAVFEDENFYTGQTLYFQSNKVGETVEITAYS